jgi:hypothetical protein
VPGLSYGWIHFAVTGTTVTSTYDRQSVKHAIFFKPADHLIGQAEVVIHNVNLTARDPARLG